MVSAVDIVNRAFDLLGLESIVTLDDRSPLAAKARRLWPAVRDSVLRAHGWKCAHKRQMLARLEQAPSFGFAFAYALPADFIRLVATHPYDARYSIAGRNILADTAELGIAYVARIEDCTLYDPLLCECMAVKLAAEFCYGDTAGVSMRVSLLEQFERSIREAAGIDAREGEAQVYAPSKWSKARRG